MRTRLATLTMLAAALWAAAAAPAHADSWKVLSTKSPVRSIHATLMHTGKVLLMAGSGNNYQMFQAGQFYSVVWNPTSQTFGPLLKTPTDLFCAGHAILPDGDVLVAGGTLDYPQGAGYSDPTDPAWPITDHYYEGSPASYLFSPTTERFTRLPDMSVGRWYPTLVELGNGSILAAAGLDQTGIPTQLVELFGDAPFGTDAWTLSPTLNQYFPSYPGLVLLANGDLLYTGTGSDTTGARESFIWDLSDNESYDIPGGIAYPDLRDEGSTLLLPPAQAQQVMVMGGGHVNYPEQPATNSTQIINLSSVDTHKAGTAPYPTPSYQTGPNMPMAKMDMGTVILPNSQVLVTGGSTYNRRDPILTANIYHPSTRTFTRAASPHVPRMYHSESLLLPTGQVATFGSNPQDDSFEMRIEVYSPDYMTQARPKITAAPTGIRYGGTYKLSGSSTIRSAVLIAAASVTHSTDPQQRLVSLGYSASKHTFTVPSNPNLAPPGYYMLFVRTAAGVPSVAHWVHLS